MGGPAAANFTLPQLEDALRNVGTLFYVVDPISTSFPDMASIPRPDYISQAFPYFFLMGLLEWSLLWAKGEMPRINDGLLSIIHGLIMLLMESVVSGALFAGYLYIYNNYCLFPLPWDSLWTWIFAALGIDLAYYWVHRAAHEINLLWAAHQVHHSSEHYNLSTALRQSAFQSFGSWPFYLPLAFLLPPSHAIVHKEFNTLYQFWIHTELVTNLGPLEYVLNTASHHRVHHGANRYCLDKNYAGVLIIWDRMFGTFEAERSDPPLVYGLVDAPQFWNPLRHQFFYYGNVWEKAISMKDWTGFFSAFVKGPGWFPGTPRLGDISFVEERPVRLPYDAPHSPWLHVYTISQTLLAFALTILVMEQEPPQLMSPAYRLGLILYVLWMVTDVGILYEGGPWAWPLELVRCLASLLMLGTVSCITSRLPIHPHHLRTFFTGSAVVSLLCTAKSSIATKQTSKME